MSTFSWGVTKAVEASPRRIKRSDMGDGYSQRSGDGLNTILPKWDVEIKDDILP